MPAAGPVPPLARWLMPSIEDVIFLCMLGVVLSQGSGLFGDGDTGWHIRTGEYILQTHSIPRQDFYSYTVSGTPWVAHEWLSEVVLAALHRYGGLMAVGVFTGLVISASIFILLRYMMRLGLNVFSVLVTIVFVSMVTKIHWLARPHIFSFFFTVAATIALERYEKGEIRHLYILAPMMFLWTNLHSGFVIGFALIGVYAIGNIFRALWAASDAIRELGRARATHLLWTGGLSLVASSINPQGPAILLFPLRHVGMTLHINRISEWISPDFHNLFVFEVLVLFILLVLWLGVVRINSFEVSLLLLWAHLSFFSVRFVPLFALTQAPLIARGVDGLAQHVRAALRAGHPLRWIGDRLGRVSHDLCHQSREFDRHLIAIVISAAVLIVGIEGGALGVYAALSIHHDKTAFPVGAVDFMEKNHFEGRLFHTDLYGGYLIYRLYPRVKVAIDGRGEVYGRTGFFEKWLTVFDALPGWENILDEYHVGTVLWPSNKPTTALLRSSPEWALVYSDETASVFVRNDAAHQDLIRRLGRVSYVFPKEKGDGD